MILPNDIIKELIDQTDDHLFLVCQRFYNLTNELIEIWKKSIPMNITKYKIKNFCYYRKFYLELTPYNDYVHVTSKDSNILSLNELGDAFHHVTINSLHDFWNEGINLDIVYMFKCNNYWILINNLGQAYHGGFNLVLNTSGRNGTRLLPRTKNITAVAGDDNRLIFYIDGEFILYTLAKSFIVGKLDVKIKSMSLINYCLIVIDINNKTYICKNIIDNSLKPVIGQTNVRIKF